VKRALLVLAPLVIGALFLSGCGVKTTHKSMAAAPVQGGTGWKPSTPIKVKKGDKVVIKVGNETKVTHGFSIDAFGVKQTAVAGGAPSLEALHGGGQEDVVPLPCCPVVVGEDGQAHGHRVPLLDQVADEHQVAQRLGHLLPAEAHHALMHPVAHEGAAGRRL